MKKPDFLIIGAARSGTTTLAHCLHLHPEIYLPLLNEEPKFFSREQEYAKGDEYYLNRYFSSVNVYQIAGEKSTEYMENSSTAGRIYNFNPAMKIICILRNPVERAIANYWWTVKNGFEKRPLNEAIRSEWENYLKTPQKITALYSVRPYAYIDRSLYYENLLPFYVLFPSANIRCLIFEEFTSDRKTVIEHLFLFLGVKLMNLPLDSIKAQRPAERSQSLDPNLYKELMDFFYEKNKKLPGLIGVDIDLHWYKNV